MEKNLQKKYPKKAAPKAKRAMGVFGALDGKRGSLHDPLERLFVTSRDLPPQVCRSLYESSWFARNVVDIISEDMTREWCVVRTGDEAIDAIVEKYMHKLDVQSKFHDMVRYEMIYGNGIILMAIEDGKPLSAAVGDNIQSVRFLNVIVPVGIDATINKDIVSPLYGDIEKYIFPSVDKKIEVHSSRVLHLTMRALYGEKFGKSAFVPILQIAQVVDSAEWSVGQIVYSMVTKVVKGNFSTLTDKEYVALREDLDKALNALTTVMLDKNEEFQYVSPAGVSQGVSALLDFVWQCASAALRMPRTHLIGQQAGAIAGAREDTRTYYARVRSMQKAYLEPLLKKLVYVILLARDGAGLKREDLRAMNIEIKFNPLGVDDEQAAAQALLDRAKAVQVLVDTGIIDLEQAKKIMGV